MADLSEVCAQMRPQAGMDTILRRTQQRTWQQGEETPVCVPLSESSTEKQNVGHLSGLVG